MSEERISFMEILVGVVKKPYDTFNLIWSGDMWRGLSVLTFVAILASLAGYIYAAKLPINMQEMGAALNGQTQIDLEALRGTLSIFLAMGNFVGVYTRWIIPSILIILAANLTLGEGSGRRMCVMTCFASIPQVVQHALRILDAVTADSVVVATVIASRASSTLVMMILNQAITVLNLFGLLTFVLTVYAVSANYGTNTRKAFYTTSLAYAVYILVKVYLPL